MDQKSNRKAKTMKLLKKHEIFMTLDLEIIYQILYQKFRQQKKKIGKSDFVRIKSLYIEGLYQQSQQSFCVTHKMEENIWKSYI